MICPKYWLFVFFSGKFVQWKVIIGAYDLKPVDYNYHYDDDYEDYYYEEEKLISYDFSITNFKRHPKYVQGKKYYDVAVIKLGQRVQLGQFDKQIVNVVCLPGQVTPFAAKTDK